MEQLAGPLRVRRAATALGRKKGLRCFGLPSPWFLICSAGPPSGAGVFLRARAGEGGEDRCARCDAGISGVGGLSSELAGDEVEGWQDRICVGGFSRQGQVRRPEMGDQEGNRSGQRGEREGEIVRRAKYTAGTGRLRQKRHRQGGWGRLWPRSDPGTAAYCTVVGWRSEERVVQSRRWRPARPAAYHGAHGRRTVPPGHLVLDTGPCSRRRVWGSAWAFGVGARRGFQVF